MNTPYNIKGYHITIAHGDNEYTGQFKPLLDRNGKPLGDTALLEMDIPWSTPGPIKITKFKKNLKTNNLAN